MEEFGVVLQRCPVVSGLEFGGCEVLVGIFIRRAQMASTMQVGNSFARIPELQQIYAHDQQSEKGVGVL
jgi:hypothetical protein